MAEKDVEKKIEKGNEAGAGSNAGNTSTNSGGSKDNFTADEVKELLAEQSKKSSEEHETKLKDIASLEKNKLYDTIRKEKDEKEALQKKLSTFEEADKLKAADDEKKRVEELDIKDRLMELEGKTATDNKRFQQMMEIKDKEFDAALKKRDLALYKERKVANAKGGIIPELVLGNSEKEIDEAYDKAVNRYEEIRDGEKKKLEANLINNGKLPGPDGGKDVVPGDDISNTPSGKNWEDVHKMSPDEFEKYKEDALKQFS